MKRKTWKHKLTALGMAVCLGAIAFTGCGSKAESSESTEDTGTSEALVKYTVEDVGTFYLPEGFETDSGSESEPLPMTWAQLTSGSILVSASRFGTDAYEAAGVELPSDLKDYSQRAGVRQNLPEDVEFAEDSYGNLFVQYTEDGNTIYMVLKQGAESYGTIHIICPEGEEQDDFALWASKFSLK